MKKLLSLITLLSFVAATYAAEQITTITGSTITSLRQGPLKVNSITVQNNNPDDVVNVYIYDAPTNVLTYVVASYVVPRSYSTNIVRSITNYFGVVTTETNAALFTYPYTVPQTTNTFPLLTSFLSVAAAGGTATYVPTGGRFLGYGLAATNSVTNVVITLNHSPAF